MASRVRRWSAHRRPRTGLAGISGSIRSHIASVITKRTDTSDQLTTGSKRHALGLRVQVSASYLSRVLSGEKFPTWEVTEKIALVLGADTDAVRKVWQDERDRHGIRSRRTRQPFAPEEPDAGTSLAGALRTLYQRAAGPSPHSVAVATGHLISADDVRRILHGEKIGTWEEVSALMASGRPLWRYSSLSTPPPTAAGCTAKEIHEVTNVCGVWLDRGEG
ncbi:helix-turn-helix transcriptional regulator [Streptomyces sp. NPDC093516]|uniref:helix-turn-helix transcriptional regulator n=1 Tax=Streptomyces sp. NPDC093516 TaxID=3155304 RepID=UPI003415934A